MMSITKMMYREKRCRIRHDSPDRDLWVEGKWNRFKVDKVELEHLLVIQKGSQLFDLKETSKTSARAPDNLTSARRRNKQLSK